MPHTRSKPDPNAMTLGEHLEDLRRRIILAALGLVPIFALATLVGRQLLGTLISPVQRALREQGLPAGLQATSPTETFFAYFKIATIVTIIVGSPWVLYQAWLFISPGLYRAERRFVHLLLPMSGLLSILGVLFLYFVLLPVVLVFFINFGSTIGQSASPTIEPPPGLVFPNVPVLAGDPPSPELGQTWINTILMQQRVCIRTNPVEIRGTDLTKGFGIAQQYRVSEYIKMVLSLALAFAVGFQTPVAVLLLGWAGLVERPMLVKYRKQAIMICALSAALLTPADPLSMVLLAVPLYLLFELGGLLIVLLPARKVAGESVEDEA